MINTGKYTRVDLKLLTELGAKIKDKFDGVEVEHQAVDSQLADTMDDVLDDVVRFISENSLIASLFEDLASKASLESVIERVKKECSLSDVFSKNEALSSLSQQEITDAVNISDMIREVRTRCSPDEVFDTKDLEDWAINNGYELTPEETISRAHS